MMGQTNIGSVTFEGLKAPGYVSFYGAELRCTIIVPDKWFARFPLSWAIGITIPHTRRCRMPDVWLRQPHLPRTAHCKSWDEPHPTTDPNCPRCERQAINKAWVRKALENELPKLQPSSGNTVSSETAETHHSRTPMKAEKSRSKRRSKSRRKSKTHSKSRTHFKSRTRSKSQTRSQSRTLLKSRSCSCEESWRLSKTRTPSPSTRKSYKKALQGKPVGKEVHASSEQQWATERNATKVATREVGQVEVLHSLLHPADHSPPRLLRSLNPRPLILSPKELA
ncbi:hypothetical protein HPB51_008391 [Rhipicephalus microplus]|uniref:Uncharacterized protein n=1 Tax=Rhipicephalus microplus TaxID=6941 RepID=A0A9J6DTZ7_RHIMP|nr:hypothetical protein HPB51_008391 [Rhipicephalus microplus]